MDCTSQPGPGVYVNAVCMVEALESQGRSQEDLAVSYSFSVLSFSTSQRQPTPQAELRCPDTKHIAEEPFLCCVFMMKVESQVKM